MNFDRLVENYLKESYTDATPQQVGEQFIRDFLSRYEYNLSGKGHLSSIWVTKMFCEWIKQYGVGGENTTVIYFVWPQKETVKDLKRSGILPKDYKSQGESHIAPIFKNHILDFTIGQFIPDRQLLVTPVAQWKNVYGKYGYGTNSFKGQEIFIGTYETVAQETGMAHCDKSSLSKRKM